MDSFTSNTNEMNNELTTATADRIKELHETVMQSVSDATTAVNAAMMASVEIGGHIKQINKGQRMAWLAQNVPNISHKKIAAYLSIEATYRKRPDNAIDHRFFALLGMTDTTTSTDTISAPTKSAKPQWIAWTGKLTGYFAERIKQTPANQWEEGQRVAVREQLKPIVELYNSLGQ